MRHDTTADVGGARLPFLRFTCMLALLAAGALPLEAQPVAGTRPSRASETAAPQPEPGGEPAPGAGLRVMAEIKSGHPIPVRITGKFAEHLYSNICNGMCAQILRNPTFADFAHWNGSQTPDGRLCLHDSESDIAAGIRGRAGRYRWPEDQIALLTEARQDALAHWWVRVGPRDAVHTSPDTGPYGGRAQRVEVAAAGQGIAQWTHLPLHRIRRYEYLAVVRSPDLKTLTLSLSNRGAGTPAAEAQVAGVLRKWNTLRGTIDLPPAAPADSIYRLALTTSSPGQFVIERLLLWPADHVGGADPDVIRLLKESHLPLLRWPGGNFASGYHWEDGVGPIERRPTRHNIAWGGVEPNLFGIDEFIAFCRAVGCEPMICLNAGDGTPEEAVRWIEYCNGPAGSPMGARRAANGHPEPYNVQLWEVGNELWGRWQVHWSTPRGYADRFREFTEAINKASPGLTLYACGAPIWRGQEWNEALIREANGVLQRTTDHPLIGDAVPASTEPLDVYRNFMAVPRILEKKWAGLRDAMLKAGIREPKLAITELQLFAHIIPAAGGPVKLTHANLVSPATQAEAIYDTLMYHAAIRLAPFVDMVTHSATVNHGGGLRKEFERVYANPCHYAQSAFSAFGGATPVMIELDAPMESAPTVLPDFKKDNSQMRLRTIEALAALGRDGDLLLSIVHCGTQNPTRLKIDLLGFRPAPQAEVWSLSADVPWAANTFREQDAVQPSIATAAVASGSLVVDIKPYTVMRVRVPAANGSGSTSAGS